MKRIVPPLTLIAYVTLLAFFFANVEVQIEGPHGWAEKLPTWRIESGLLLDIFWGGRPLTGYHAWIFSFMALVFHLPLLFIERIRFAHEFRILGSLMLFWIIEDMLWFVLNPAYGASALFAGKAPWHKHMLFGLPHDYWLFGIAGTALLMLSYRRSKCAAD